MCCSVENQISKEEVLEEVKEEFTAQTAQIQQFSAALIKTCRIGYRLMPSGQCRLVLGATESP